MWFPLLQGSHFRTSWQIIQPRHPEGIREPVPRTSIPPQPKQNLKWLQFFLLKCGGGNRHKVKSSKHHEAKSSLDRKLNISESSCKRKCSPHHSCSQSQQSSPPSSQIIPRVHHVILIQAGSQNRFVHFY